MSRRMRPCSIPATLAALVAACSSDVKLPAPPLAEETAAIADTYENPPGVIDVARLDAIAAEVGERIEEHHIDVLAQVIASGLAGLRERFDETSIPADPAASDDSDRALIKAVVRLNRTCRGFHDATGERTAAENGSLLLTATVDRSQLGRDLWGEFSTCETSMETSEERRLDAAVDLFVDGTLMIHLYAPLPETAAEASFLARFTGELGSPGEPRTREFDFRAMEGTVEFRHEAEGGEIIVGISRDAFTLRGSNATFSCDFATLSCA